MVGTAGVGFEPTGRLHAQRFSRPPRSTAPAPRRALYSSGFAGLLFLGRLRSRNASRNAHAANSCVERRIVEEMLVTACVIAELAWPSCAAHDCRRPGREHRGRGCVPAAVIGHARPSTKGVSARSAVQSRDGDGHRL
jgi:hypothetical protein